MKETQQEQQLQTTTSFLMMLRAFLLPRLLHLTLLGPLSLYDNNRTIVMVSVRMDNRLRWLKRRRR